MNLNFSDLNMKKERAKISSDPLMENMLPFTIRAQVWKLTFQVFCGDEAEGDHEGDFLEEKQNVMKMKN